MNKKFKFNKPTIIFIASLFAILLVLPFLAFWASYFVGWISKILIGKQLVTGFALIGIDLPLDKIPLLAGCLGWISCFFIHNNNSQENF